MVKKHCERSTSCWTSVTSVILGFFRSGPQRRLVVANSFGAANAQEAAQLGGLHYSLHRRRFVSASPSLNWHCWRRLEPELGEGKQSSRAVPVLCSGTRAAVDGSWRCRPPLASPSLRLKQLSPREPPSGGEGVNPGSRGEGTGCFRCLSNFI